MLTSLLALLAQPLDARGDVRVGGVAPADDFEHVEGALVLVVFLEEPGQAVAGLEGHALGALAADHLLDLLLGQVEVALLLEHVHQQVRGLHVVAVVRAEQLEAADRAALVAVLERHLGRLEGLAALLESLDPARDVAGLAEALGGALVVARALEDVAGLLDLAGRAVHLGGARELAGALEERCGLLVVRELRVDLGGLQGASGLGVVAGRGLVLLALLVQARQQQVRQILLALALEGARRRRDVAVEVGLHRRRAAREEELLAVGEVDRHVDRLEGVHLDFQLGHAVAASHHQGVAAALRAEPHRAAARVAQRVGRAAPGDERLRHRALVPQHLHVHRALLGAEVEVEARRVAAPHVDLLLLEVAADHGLLVRRLHEAVDGHVPAAGENLAEVGLARDEVALGAARGAGAPLGALGGGRGRGARPLAAGRLLAGDAHAEGAAQLGRVLDRDLEVALAAQELEQQQQDRHGAQGRQRQGLRVGQAGARQPAVDRGDRVVEQPVPLSAPARASMCCWISVARRAQLAPSRRAASITCVERVARGLGQAGRGLVARPADGPGGLGGLAGGGLARRGHRLGWCRGLGGAAGEAMARVVSRAGRGLARRWPGWSW